MLHVRIVHGETEIGSHVDLHPGPPGDLCPGDLYLVISTHPCPLSPHPNVTSCPQQAWGGVCMYIYDWVRK